MMSGTRGGADRDRTDDLRLAKPALSQLSYSPSEVGGWWAWVDLNYRPPAYQADALTGLSYRPIRSDRIQSARATALLRSVPEKRMSCGDGYGRTVESCPDRTSHRENPGFTASRRSGSAGRLDRTRPGNRRLELFEAP
jgi:hypothetical protein